MPQPSFKDAVTVCKTIMRNGFDAYVINAKLQSLLIERTGRMEIDLACEAPQEELSRVFQSLEPGGGEGLIGILKDNGTVYRFYPTDTAESSHPDNALRRLTPNMQKRLRELGLLHHTHLDTFLPGGSANTPESEFFDFQSGNVQLKGLPDVALRHDYLLGIKALRYAANFDLGIEQNTWLAIIRAAQRIIDYVPANLIMDEWRKVEAESMWKFARLLFDCQLMHGLLPEVAALSVVPHARKDNDSKESVLDHTLRSMRHYPEDGFTYDWYGTFAMLFHQVGMLYTAEFHNEWTFYQHHRVSAKVTRKILRRLRLPPEDIDLICHLVLHNMRFHFMLTDKGIRRFKALDEYPRLIAMARADIKAGGDNYTAFNHNMKYLTRAETPEQMLEPLLNGNEIMEHTGLTPGPHVGLIREALLKAQVAGEVNNGVEAVVFVTNYAKDMTTR